MNKRKISAAALLTALLLILLSAASCGSDTDNDKLPYDSQNDTSSNDTNADTDDGGRLTMNDSLPADLDLGGRDIRIYARGGDYDTTVEIYSESMTGDVINDAVYARNKSVEDRLNVKFDIILGDYNRHAPMNDSIRSSIMSGSDDYDLVSNHLRGSIILAPENVFLDFNSLDYIDFSKPWWNHAFIEMTEQYGKNYVAIGDISQTMISGTFCMFFNKSMFEELMPNEQSLYKTVLEGGWTLDKMTAYCTDLYADLNGNTTADEGDRFGHYFTNTLTLGADAFAGGCGIDMIVRDGDKYVYRALDERNVTFIEKMKKLLFEDNNTCRLQYNDDTIMKTMLNSQTMFTAWMLTGVNYLRDMKEDYGIIPMPKLDENQAEYKTFIHDGSSVFSIPTTASKPDEVAAVLEAMCAETYRSVTPAYFGVALKSKYSRDDETSQMLDMIVESIYLDTAHLYEYTPTSTLRWILSDKSNCDSAISRLASEESQVIKGMEDILKQYREIAG